MADLDSVFTELEVDVLTEALHCKGEEIIRSLDRNRSLEDPDIGLSEHLEVELDTVFTLIRRFRPRMSDLGFDAFVKQIYSNARRFSHEK